jgi:hypothetical protein
MTGGRRLEVAGSAVASPTFVVPSRLTKGVFFSADKVLLLHWDSPNPLSKKIPDRPTI